MRILKLLSIVSEYTKTNVAVYVGDVLNFYALYLGILFRFRDAYGVRFLNFYI